MQTIKSKPRSRASRARASRRETQKIDILEDGKTEDQRRSSPKGFKIRSKEEQKRRESIEICRKHNMNIIAIENGSGKTMCENCVYDESSQSGNYIFTASVAKGIEKCLKAEVKEFKHLINEFRSFENVKDGIETKISEFFELLRRKITVIEKKTVEKVQKSENLAKLVDSLNQVNCLLEKDSLEEKYDDELEEVELKIKNNRYTYICQNKKIYDN